MNFDHELSVFLEGIRDDPRICPSHISLFLAILQYSREHERQNPICIFSRDLMPLAKISAAGTYHRCVRELQEYGYIKYAPSYNHFLGSLVYLFQSNADANGIAHT
jgi:hypothetical protein